MTAPTSRPGTRVADRTASRSGFGIAGHTMVALLAASANLMPPHPRPTPLAVEASVLVAADALMFVAQIAPPLGLGIAWPARRASSPGRRPHQEMGTHRPERPSIANEENGPPSSDGGNAPTRFPR